VIKCVIFLIIHWPFTRLFISNNNNNNNLVAVNIINFVQCRRSEVVSLVNIIRLKFKMSDSDFHCQARILSPLSFSFIDWLLIYCEYC